MSKQRAFLLHLSISAAVVGTLLAIIFFVWYPYPFFEIAGAWNVVRILIGVDLILGPLLTLILYRPGKRFLLLDLAFIAVIQLAALVYGVVTIHGERPRYAIFAVDRFVVLSDSEIDRGSVPDAVESERPARGPLFAVARLPSDHEAHNALMFDILEGGPDIEFRPTLWHPYSDASGDVVARLAPLDRLTLADGFDARELQRVARRTALAPDELGYVPVLNKAYEAFALVIDRKTAKPVDIIAVDPWSVPRDPPPE